MSKQNINSYEYLSSIHGLVHDKFSKLKNCIGSSNIYKLLIKLQQNLKESFLASLIYMNQKLLIGNDFF